MNQIKVSDAWRFLTLCFEGGWSTNSVVEIIKFTISIVDSDANNILLKNIDTNVKRLLHHHLGSGKDFLADALKEKDQSKQEKYLDDARRAFIAAANVELPPEDAKASEYVAICHQCLGNMNLALDWYYKSYEKAKKYHVSLLDYIKRIDNNEMDMERALLGGSMTPFYGAVVLPFSFYLYDKKQKRYCEKLMELFDVEIHVRHLYRVLLALENQVNPPVLYFPGTVVQAESYYRFSIERLSSSGVKCYDEDMKLIKDIKYPQ